MRKLLPAVLCALAVAGCDAGGGDEAAGGSGAPADAAAWEVPPPRPAGDGRVEAFEIRAPGLRDHLRALQEIADANGGNWRAATSTRCPPARASTTTGAACRSWCE